MLGFAYVLLAGVGFGFLGIFARLGFNRGLSVGEILTWRFAAATILLWLFTALFKRKIIFLEFKQILISLALGCFGYSLFSTLYFMSIEGISVSLAALLLFTFPLFVNLGAHFILKEKLCLRQIFSLVLASVGILALLWGPVFVNSFNCVGYALLAAISYSIYVLVSGRYQKGVHPLSSSLYVISSTTITLFVFHRPSISRLLNFSSSEFFIIMGLALICTVGPLTLFLAGLQKLKSSKASIIVTVEPVVAAIAAWVFLNETININQFLGAILVLASLFVNALD